jgi:hypothetical protein
METKISAIRAIQVWDMFFKLFQKNVGTREVESCSKGSAGPKEDRQKYGKGGENHKKETRG